MSESTEVQMVTEFACGCDHSPMSRISIVFTLCCFVDGKFCYRCVIVSCVCSPQFPMGAGGDGPLGGMAGMEPHHMNGSLGTGIRSFTLNLWLRFPLICQILEAR